MFCRLNLFCCCCCCFASPIFRWLFYQSWPQCILNACDQLLHSYWHIDYINFILNSIRSRNCVHHNNGGGITFFYSKPISLQWVWARSFPLRRWNMRRFCIFQVEIRLFLYQEYRKKTSLKCFLWLNQRFLNLIIFIST